MTANESEREALRTALEELLTAHDHDHRDLNRMRRSESVEEDDGTCASCRKARRALRGPEPVAGLARDFIELHDADEHSDATWPCDGQCRQARALRAALGEKP